MTEPELITALTNSSVDARAVLAMLSAYANANGDVTLTLSDGVTYTIPGIGKQRNQITADFDAQRLAFTQDFGGAVAGQTITRNASRIATGIETVFSSGLKLSHEYTRNAFGSITSILVTVRDALDVVLVTGTKTINRTNGLVSSIT